MAEEKRRRRSAAAGADPGPGAGVAPRIPRWLPPVLYGLATLWIFRTFVFSDDLLFGGDTLSLGYMARDFFAERLRAGDFPRWNPLILGGTPFLEALSGGDALYPTSLLLLVMDTHRALGWKLVLHVFVAGLLMFGWARALGVSRAAALVAGLAYGAAPFLVSFVQPGHDGKLFVTALTPLMFWTAERTFTRGGLLPYVGVALTVALVLFTTHFQMAYFLFGAVGAFYLFRVWQVGRGRETAVGREGASVTGRRPALLRLALFLAASVVGAAAAGVQLFPAVDYVTEHSRRTATTTGADEADNVAYSSSYSLHPEDVVSYVVPEFNGNGAGGAAWATGTYWSRNGAKDNHQYAGLVVVLLAVLSFFGAPRRGLRLFLVGLAAVALLYALGGHTPVWRIFYEVVPGIDLFRAPDIASFLVGFALVTLAAFGVDVALGVAAGGADEARTRGMTMWMWGTAGALALFALLAASGALFSMWTSTLYKDIGPFQMQALERARPFIVRGAFVAVLLALATGATLWAARRGVLRASGVAAVLALLVGVDALRIDGAFVQTFQEKVGISFQAWASPDANVDFLLDRQAEGEPFRVASLTSDAQDVRPAMFGLEMATGHHPNDLQRYRELIGMRGSQAPETLLHPNVLALLNIRYLLVPGVIEGVEAVSQTSAENVYALPTLPRARLVAEAEVVEGAAAVARILEPGFDPARTAVLAEAPPVELGGGVPEGGVEWLERTPDRLRLRVTTDRASLLVLAENWFPAWHATVDGEEAPVLRAYHTLRAVPVGAGQHTVELTYRSPLLRGSAALSAVTLALLLGALAFGMWRGRARGDQPVVAG